MDMNMRRVVTAERARLVPHVERVNGAEMRESFWGAFDGAASRFALDRIDVSEFRAVVRELVRDAAGTASQQDRDAGAAQLWGSTPPVPSRAPWATMPTDGSGTLTAPERVLYAVIGAACVVALLVMGWTLGVFGGSDADAPRTPVQVVTDADLITQGGYWSWQAADACGRGPAECDKTLREVNAAAERYGVRVWEDGTISPAGRQY